MHKCGCECNCTVNYTVTCKQWYTVLNESEYVYMKTILNITDLMQYLSDNQLFLCHCTDDNAIDNDNIFGVISDLHIGLFQVGDTVYYYEFES